MVGLSVAVVIFGASVWSSPRPAGADQVSDAKAQVAALQQQVLAGAGRVRTLTLAYEQADTRAGALSQQVAADQASLNRLKATVAATAAALRADAILSYTGGGGTPGTQRGAVAGSDDPAVRAEYLQVAVGDLSDVVDRYRTQMAQLGAAEAALSAEARAADSAVQSASAARRDALAEATGIQSQLSAVQSRLQTLEAAQAEAAARAAAQARARAQAQAAAEAAAAAAAATQGLPVNGGLVAVVRNVVAPAPPAAASSSGVWLQLRQCESGDDYQANTGNGFFGAYQFSQQTWTNLGYPGRPDLEPPAMQDQAAQKLQSESGWGQWPACSAALGLS